jgi:hypothetical protein
MSDVEQPTIAEVRSAAEAVKAAIDRHLAAVEARTGENDPGVLDAYDSALYDVYDEVTPFEVPNRSDVSGFPDPDEPEAISVLIRRDYQITDPLRLRASALSVDSGPEAAAGVSSALAALFAEFEPDEIAGRAEEFGLEEGDSTLWVSAANLAEPGEWLAEPFEDADPELLICRFDVSEAYDDELEALDPER